MKKPIGFRFRSAVTGHYVSFWYAITHPRTTVWERTKGMTK